MGNGREFQEAAERLSHVIRGAGTLWQDENYRQLSSSVAGLGRQTRDVLEAQERCRRSVEYFHQIAREKY